MEIKNITYSTKLSNKLKQLRNENNISQSQMAEIANISQSNYSKYELGVIEPKIFSIIRIADYFNSSIDYICDRKAEEIIIDEKSKTILKLIQQLTDRNKDQAFYYISGLLAGQ